MIFGYDSLISDFKRLADERRLAHAYLFFGDPEVGKFLFAESLANYLENDSFEEPKKDLKEALLIDFDELQKKSSQSNQESIGIDAVREIGRFLFQTPIASAYRLAIIRDAEWLTDQAQNALLKIVEEPPPSGVIIAIAKDPGVFLPTISSRFLKIYFPRLSSGKILDFLSEYGKIKDVDMKETASKAFGRIGRALRIVRQKKSLEKIENLISSVLSKKTPAVINDLTEKILSLGDKDPRKLDLFFEELILKLNQNLPQNSSTMASVNQTLWLLKTLTVNKRIQIKKMLSDI
ncbi:MAG: polymerase III subunit delta' protein [Candidatus Wolfebacteria bacterium GW2011_GWC1_43_10]|uniref:Polymerase III subunit delta' protein n=1 Tax=Candidatus Wolfebacteria bacterium GW2011_GWC1_43_10 TaxID=1619011 RepID=A0A0G1CBR9_9BACT|nr:MAG: polymerase III subunit delta' protein [Candidatus Wolfebacteria bacterium GW2011_GWC1_43_10]KKT22721.1 MAG: polymerase III subunit delta' protein [Parcubacteria group bacterium GW2011_GWB1_43_8b]